MTLFWQESLWTDAVLAGKFLERLFLQDRRTGFQTPVRGTQRGALHPKPKSNLIVLQNTANVLVKTFNGTS